MIGKREGLVKLIENEALLTGNINLMKYHCIIHLGSVMNVVIKTVHFIHFRGFKHRQFQGLLYDLDSEFGDVVCYSEVTI